MNNTLPAWFVSIVAVILLACLLAALVAVGATAQGIRNPPAQEVTSCAAVPQAPPQA